jgi:hypothetical protein
VDELLAGPDEFDAVPTLAEAFPLRVFPDAVGLGPDGRENLLPYGNHLFNAFGPPNALVEAGNGRAAELAAWIGAQCTRDALSGDGFGAAIWAASDRGEITPEQAPDRSLAAVRGRRHDRARHRGGAARVRDPSRAVAPSPRASGPRPRRVRRGGALAVPGADLLPHRDA